MKILLDTSKSVEENASIYFDKAKKMAKKIEGAEEALEKKRKELSALEKTQSTELERIEKEERRKSKKKEWFEKFRWFITSEGFLVVGGRDATTNEVIIKKHTETGDRVFHTDITGSPFFVLKCGESEVSEGTLREVADATCTFSRAWKQGISTTPVFWVRPDQVSKKANTGEFLTKGAFMIRGKTNYVDNQVNLAIGCTKEGKIMGGPVAAIKKHCEVHVVLSQGTKKASEVAKSLKERLDATPDDIIRALPAGEFKIKK